MRTGEKIRMTCNWKSNRFLWILLPLITVIIYLISIIIGIIAGQYISVAIWRDGFVDETGYISTLIYSILCGTSTMIILKKSNQLKLLVSDKKI